MRNITRLWLLAAICTVAHESVASEPATEPSFASRLETFQSELDSIRADYNVPGMTAAFVLPDGRTGAAAAGDDDVTMGRKMLPQTRLMSGSTGKTFAAAVALRLVTERRLELDAPVSKWLGERPWFDRLANARQITLRQLLNHTSGLKDYVYSPRFPAASAAKRTTPDDTLTPEDCIALILDEPAAFAPGAGFAYADTNYLLAGLVIEQATGRAFYELAREWFLDPLGLTLTTPADRRRLPGLGQGYPDRNAGFPLPERTLQSPGVMAWNPASEWTGGGFVTNPQDLARWAKSLYEGKAWSGNYLDQLLHGVPARTGETYGLGVEMHRSPYGAVYGHGGWYPGYRTDMAYYPEYRVAIALQINTTVNVSQGSKMAAIRDRLMAALVGKPATATQ